MEAAAADEPIQSSFVRIFAAIVAGVIGLSFVMTNMSRKAVIANWAKRRCDVGVMFTSFLYKPDDYAGSSMDFASENFDFCMKFLAAQTLGQATSPVINIMESQVKSGGIIQDIQNGIRSLIAGIVNSFSSVLQKFYETYRQGMLQFARIIQTLRSMIGRVEGSVISTMYAFLSGYTGIQNAFDFILKIAIMMVNIIGGMFVLMFFTFLPFLPLLIGTTKLITAAGYGDKVKGPAAIFCFNRGTPIHTVDGLKPIEQLVAGTHLKGGGVFEGMYRFDGSATPLYLLGDVLVSGSHLVYGPDNSVRAVADDERARSTELISPVLYCPIVSNRVLYAGKSAIKFADWEEVAGDAEDVYDAEVRRLLGFSGEATLAPGFTDNTVGVITRERGLMKISDAKIGEHILDANDKYSKILGVMQRSVCAASYAEATDGVIAWNGNGWKYISDPTTMTTGDPKSDGSLFDIYHIITDSGTFAIHTEGRNDWTIVRDATEVGLERLDDLTPLVLSSLNGTEYSRE